MPVLGTGAAESNIGLNGKDGKFFWLDDLGVTKSFNLLGAGTGDMVAANNLSDVANTDTARGNLSAKKIGKESMWIPATGMTPATTSGAATGQHESSTNKVNIEVLDFDKDADEFAHFNIAFPKAWNLGTVTFQAFWTAATGGTTGVAWALQGVAIGDNVPIDTAYGTAVVVTDDAQTGAHETYVTVESGAVTIAETPADDDLCYFRLFRDVSDANDDLAEDARLLGIKIFFTLDAEDDT